MNIEDLYQKIIEDWRLKAKGKGIINFTKKVKPYPIVLGILQRVYERDPTSLVYIIVNKYETRTNLIKYLTKTDNEENNKEFAKLISNKNIRILTYDKANTWDCNIYMYLLVTIGINDYSNCINTAIFMSKFQLICVDADSKDKTTFYKKCVPIGGVEISEIIKAYESSPVEEYQIGLNITDQTELTLLDKYNKFITDSAKILGGFDRIDLIKNGNPLCNVSSTQVCIDIAHDNGWSEDLDMSIEFNKNIDAIYNPIVIRERAEQVYDLIRKRRKLISENTIKLKTILDICLDNPDKKILIINKSSEFAKIVTAYLNDNMPMKFDGLVGYNACYNYHEDVDKIPARDVMGRPIYVKSGVDKGKPKMLAAKAQKSLVNDYFNSVWVNIISTNSSPDKALEAKIDLLIITSPLCMNFSNYKYRLSQCSFDGNPFKVYKVYIKNTLEEKELCKEKQTENYTIVNNCEKTADFDENLGAIVVY